MRINIRETNNALKQGQVRKNSRGDKIALVVDGFQHDGVQYVRYLRIEKQRTKKHDTMTMAIAELELFKSVFINSDVAAIQIHATPDHDLIDVDYPEYKQLRNIMYRGGHFNEK